MAVQYFTYGANRVKVSGRWRKVLKAADRARVNFTVNSGHRTFQEQQALYNQNMIAPGVPKPGRPMTAVPSNTAPHIRTGEPHHALDVSTLDGGETRLESWLDRFAGVNAENTVAGEPWHLELSKLELIRVYNRVPRPRGVRQWVKAHRKGARYVRSIFKYADKHRVPRALALALVEKESAFINQYGHDRDSSGAIIWHGQRGLVKVTRKNYANYKAFRRRTGKVQGAGLTQLTSQGYQALAEAKGGGWKPDAQLDVGFEVLAGHIRAMGKRRGIGAYNGGRGNPQLDYADAVLALETKWRRIIR
jgi:hypothetical protein